MDQVFEGTSGVDTKGSLMHSLCCELLRPVANPFALYQLLESVSVGLP